MGEGGAVVTDDPLIYKSLRQFRDWGRDCWCATGKDNTCGKRFSWKLGNLPYGYDHKYSYSQIGYNLKITDIQAAIGLAQLRKIDKFKKKRQLNYLHLKQKLHKYEKYFIFSQSEKEADVCWFGFMLIVKNAAPFSKLDLVKFLEKKKIATRALFAGNLTKHPAYFKRSDIKIASKLTNSDKIMNDGFWIGIYPGITKKMIDYVASIFADFLSKY